MGIVTTLTNLSGLWELRETTLSQTCQSYGNIKTQHSHNREIISQTYQRYGNIKTTFSQQRDNLTNLSELWEYRDITVSQQRDISVSRIYQGDGGRGTHYSTDLNAVMNSGDGKAYLLWRPYDQTEPTTK
jgi:hypothetical protein